MHQRAFIDLSGNGYGLAILNRGLPAVEISRQQQGSQIALVLLRCVGWLSRDDLTTRRVAAGPLAPAPGAHCPGKFRFEYAILPHSGDWKAVFPTAYEYVSPLLVARADTHEGLNLNEMNITRDDPALIKLVPWPRGGTYPDQFSFITTDNPALVLSSVHRTEDEKGLVVRFYHLGSETFQAHFRTGQALDEAWLMNLNEERCEQIPNPETQGFSVRVKGQQILTFELRFKSGNS
jgi:alpha-mannosidase